MALTTVTLVCAVQASTALVSIALVSMALVAIGVVSIVLIEIALIEVVLTGATSALLVTLLLADAASHVKMPGPLRDVSQSCMCKSYHVSVPGIV